MSFRFYKKPHLWIVRKEVWYFRKICLSEGNRCQCTRNQSTDKKYYDAGQTTFQLDVSAVVLHLSKKPQTLETHMVRYSIMVALNLSWWDTEHFELVPWWLCGASQRIPFSARVLKLTKLYLHGMTAALIWADLLWKSPLVAQMVKICLQCGRPGFNPWVRKVPWRREWQPTPVFLPGEFHGERSLAGYSLWGSQKNQTRFSNYTIMTIISERNGISKLKSRQKTDKLFGRRENVETDAVNGKRKTSLFVPQNFRKDLSITSK